VGAWRRPRAGKALGDDDLNGGFESLEAGGGRVFSGGLFGPLASVVGEAGVLLGLRSRQPHQVHHARTWAASARPDEHGQDSESKQNRRFAQERKKVHGLGRLSAKVGKPEIDVCRLEAVPRGTTNKYDVKRLRAQGLVPAVLMPIRDTQGVGTIHLSLKDAEIERLLRRHTSEYAKSRLIRLVVPEGAGDHFRGWTDTEGEREGENGGDENGENANVSDGADEGNADEVVDALNA